MQLKYANARLVKLPADVDLILYLIQEELKATRLVNGLSDVGLGETFYQVQFATVVLAAAGFKERPDDLHEFYVDLINRRSEKLKPNHNSVARQAFKVYIDLMIEKKRRLPKRVGT